MPRKITKKNKITGRQYVIVCTQLPNGNLVVPTIIRRKPIMFVGYIEAAPGSSMHKRWLTVAESGADPRLNPDYHAQVKKVAPDLYPQIMSLKSEMEWRAEIDAKDKLERERGRDSS